MQNDENIVTKTLLALGFSPSEVLIYKILVENDYLIVSDISKLAKVPRAKAYDSLKKLELKMLVHKIDDYPIKYRAKNPKTVLKEISTNLFEQVNNGIELLYESWNNREVIDELSPIAVYYGSENYYKIFKKIETKVQNNLFILLRFIINEDEIDIIKNIITTNLKKGIKVELIVHPDIIYQINDSIISFLKQKTLFRIAPIPLRAIIIDNKEMIVQLPISNSFENINTDIINNIIIRFSDLVSLMERSIRATIIDIQKPSF